MQGQKRIGMAALRTIVFIADPVTAGGATECMLDLIEGLHVRGIRAIVCISHDSELRERVESLGARVVVTGHERFLYAPPALKLRLPVDYLRAKRKYACSYANALAKAKQLVDFGNVDLIHTNTPRMDLGVELAVAYRIPHVCHLRELSFTHFGCKSFRKYPAQYLSGRSSRLIAVSRAVKNEWAARGADSDKIAVIYDGVNIDSIVRTSQKERLGEAASSSFRIVFPGGCSTLKGVWDAIHAVEHLSKIYELHLDVYGWDSRSTLYEVLAYCKTRSLSKCIHILERDPLLYKKLHRYSCGLICSKAEGFGRAAIEMQAAGLPVIAADTGAMPELITNGVNGLLYSKGNGPADLATKIRAVYENSQLRDRLRDEGMRTCRSYSTEKNVQSVIALYETILSERDRHEN